MAFHNNPRIVTDGLVWCTDALATSSYPGSGTTWTNIGTGGGSVGLSGGASKTSDYGTAISFDGTDDYGTVLSMGTVFPDDDISIEAVFNRTFTSSAGERYIYYIYNGAYIYFRGDWAGNSCYLLRRVNGSNYYGGSAWSGTTAVALSSGNVGAPGLRSISFTMESSSTTGVGRGYINGELKATNNLYVNNAGGTNDHGGFKSVSSSTSGFFATTSASGSRADCDIANLRIYNRVLTTAEVQQNFNAQKSRFGL